MWDIATILNAELRELAGRRLQGDPDRGAGDPQLGRLRRARRGTSTSSSTSSTTPSRDSTTCEIWIHTCWGNPGAQHCFDPQISYEPSVDIYLNRLKGDVWTIESKENDHSLLPAFAPYKGNLPKKVAVGMISHRRLQVETPEDVAADIRTALEYIDADKLVLSSDCGFGRQGVPRPIAMYKAAALAQGANIVRGGARRPSRRTCAPPIPALQVDVPAREAEPVGA